MMFMTPVLTLFRNGITPSAIPKIIRRHHVSYVQGQSPSPNVREYFYYIDHQGMLFLDDSKMKNFTSCFKDKKFLHFFFTRIRVNQTNRYKDDFPFISMCGRETNYVRCDDTPVVFTHVFKDGHAMKFAYGHAANLLFHPFEPWNICMVPETGRIYHPSTEFTGGFGLIKSSLAIEISNNFLYENQLDPKPGHFESPSHIIWDGVRYSLTNSLLPLIYSKPFI